SATSSRLCRRFTRSRLSWPPPLVSRRTTTYNYPRRAASFRPAAESALDAGAALHVAEGPLDPDAGVDRVPLPRAAAPAVVVPPPVVVMPVTVPTAWA